MFNPTMPVDGTTGNVLFGQIFENDKLNRALNDAAVLITGLTRGKIVAWSATNSRWELYDGTVVPEAATIIGIVEYVGSPDTSGGVRVTGVYLDDALTDNTAYYCQSNGTLGTTETATFIGVCTDAGRLVMQGRGSGGGGGGAAIGLGDYIAEGFAVTPGTGLQAVIGTGRGVISETLVEQTATANVALLKRRAQLIYKDKTNANGVIGCKYPAYNDPAMVVRYDFNHLNGQWLPLEYWPLNATVESSGSYYIVTTAGTSAATEPTWPGSGAVTDGSVVWTKQAGAGTYVPNSASAGVANNLTPSGTVTRVDGRKGFARKGDGSTGCMTSANSTGIPTGASAREILCNFTVNSLGTNRSILGLGAYTGTLYCFDVAITTTGEVTVTCYNQTITTGYLCETGKNYVLDITYDGVTAKFCLNGTLVYSLAVTLATQASNLKLFASISGQASSGDHTIHYVELRNALRTPTQIATVAQEMLIPCAYGATDIRTVLPTDSISIAYTETSETAPTLIVDGSSPGGATPDWAYGIRVGPMGLLNRQKRLGRKSFSGTSTPEWDNPFGSRNMTIDAEWSSDAAGTNSSQIPNDAASSYPSLTINNKIRETITTGVNVAGVNKTSGYVDVICEVID